MACMAPHVDGLITARLNIFQVLIDRSKESEHFTRSYLVGIVVRREIICAERLTFFSNMAV